MSKKSILTLYPTLHTIYSFFIYIFFAFGFDTIIFTSMYICPNINLIVQTACRPSLTVNDMFWIFLLFFKLAISDIIDIPVGFVAMPILVLKVIFSFVE